MNEQELRNLIHEVKEGRLSRRAFVQGMVGLGLTAPMAGMMLGASSDIAMAAEGASTVAVVRSRWISHQPPMLRQESTITPISQKVSIQGSSGMSLSSGRSLTSTRFAPFRFM